MRSRLLGLAHRDRYAAKIATRFSRVVPADWISSTIPWADFAATTARDQNERKRFGMSKLHEIDIAYDFRTDARGKDPDSHSATLRRYHRLLWSKSLPAGKPFTLEDMRSKGYLSHRSERGELQLSSDTVLRTFSAHKRMQQIVSQIPLFEREDALHRGYTIGGMMLFPAKKIDGKQTINQSRGTNRRIEDRFDLTLECIRRHYVGMSSPLSEDLARYRTFFSLFADFQNYIDFFLLQDLVTVDYSAIRFWTPFSDFSCSPFPSDLDAYRQYRTTMLDWIDARNQRIAIHCYSHEEMPHNKTDRDRGPDCSGAPPTPPGMRVRTGRFNF